MFKKLLPLIVVLALLITYAGYRAVDARSALSAGSKPTASSAQPAAGEELAQPVIPDSGSSPTTATADLSTGDVADEQPDQDPSHCSVPRVRSPSSRDAPVPSC